MLRKLAFASLLFGLTACAVTPLPPMSDAAIDDMKANDVVVGFVYPEKKINYSELVYKVLWNESRATNSVFKGMWDIDGDLSALFAEEFRERGVDSRAIDTVMSDEGYRHFVKSMSDYAPHTANGLQAYKVDPQTRDELLEKGVEFLIAVRGKNIHVHDQALIDPAIALYYNITVVDLRSGEVAYNGGFHAGGSTKVDKSAREIEDDRLAKLRQVLTTGIEGNFESGVILKNLGLTKDAS